MQAYRGRDLAAMVTKRRLALTALLGVCLALGGCSSFAGVVSDTWPTWAGGMPKDVPPRPGAPGYEEFIAHQQRQGVAAGSAADPSVAAQAGAPGPGSASPLPKVVALAHVPGKMDTGFPTRHAQNEDLERRPIPSHRNAL